MPLAKARALPDHDSLKMESISGEITRQRTQPVRCLRQDLWVQNGYTTLSSRAANLPRTKNP